jgi:hypothetical protein
MTLDEKRLFIMATPLARTTKISSGEPILSQQRSLHLLAVLK